MKGCTIITVDTEKGNIHYYQPSSRERGVVSIYNKNHEAVAMLEFKTLCDVRQFEVALEALKARWLKKGDLK